MNYPCGAARPPRSPSCRSILIYERDRLDVRREKRIEQDDEYFRKLSSASSNAFRSAFARIEEFKL